MILMLYQMFFSSLLYIFGLLKIRNTFPKYMASCTLLIMTFQMFDLLVPIVCDHNCSFWLVSSFLLDIDAIVYNFLVILLMLFRVLNFLLCNLLCFYAPNI